jgi:Flp pilus assembly protein TadD
MPLKRRPRGKNETARENLLRPNPFLGYDHDTVASHLLKQHAYALAEGEFRRAVYLNPFEAAFKGHLAWCLYRQKRFEEAREWVVQALEQDPESGPFRQILGMVDAKLAQKNVAEEGRAGAAAAPDGGSQ